MRASTSCSWRVEIDGDSRIRASRRRIRQYHARAERDRPDRALRILGGGHGRDVRHGGHGARHGGALPARTLPARNAADRAGRSASRDFAAGMRAGRRRSSACTRCAAHAEASMSATRRRRSRPASRASRSRLAPARGRPRGTPARPRGFAHDLHRLRARLAGTPARFVSGYFMRPGLRERAAGTAWAEAHVRGRRLDRLRPRATTICPHERHVRMARSASTRSTPACVRAAARASPRCQFARRR